MGILDQGVSLSKSSRDLKQEDVVEAIWNNKGRGWLNICGGLGKTRIALMFIERTFAVRPLWRARIIVPTTELKTQWESAIRDRNIPNCTVSVINGVTLKEEEILEEIVFLDESNLLLKGKIFSRIFSLCKGHCLIPMSGTYSEDDKRIMNALMPCIYTITQREAEENGWVSQSIEYNLGIELTQPEREYYDKNNIVVDETFATFGQDFHTAMECLTYGGALNYVKANGIQGPSYEILAKEYSRKANIWQDATQKRVKFIQNHLGKIKTVAEILKALPDRKAITFGASIDAAEKLTELLPNSKTYHSQIKGQELPNELLEKYGFKVGKKGSTTKLGAKKVRELYIKMFNAGDFTRLNTVRAADLGLDISGCNCSIVYGRNSKPEKNSQREWRSTRYEGEDKLALIVNVYLKDTQDMRWLSKVQKGKKGVIKVNSVEELVNDFKKRI